MGKALYLYHKSNYSSDGIYLIVVFIRYYLPRYIVMAVLGSTSCDTKVCRNVINGYQTSDLLELEASLVIFHFNCTLVTFLPEMEGARAREVEGGKAHKGRF